MRPRLSAIKPLLFAAGLLLVSASGTELYLRIREPDGIGSTGFGSDLTEPSSTVHHRLRPLSAFRSRDPDSGEPVEIVINSHGLRGPEVAVPKPSGVYRVLCLGGETVLGPELPASDTLPARLQELIQQEARLHVEVLNGGVPGDCPLLAWLRLRESLLALQPDLILLHFDMSDVADDQRHRRRTRIDASGIPIACRHPAIAETACRPWWQDLRLTALALDVAGRLAPRSADTAAEIYDSRAATMWLRDNPPDWGLYIEQSLAPAEDIRRAGEGISAAFVLCMCPQPWQVSAEASDGPGVRESAGVAAGAVLASQAPFDAVAAFARERDIRCCDVSPALQNDSEPARLYFRNSPQLSRYGQDLYARVLSEFVATLPGFPAVGGSEGNAGASGATAAAPPDVQGPRAAAVQPWEPVRYQ